MVSLANLPTCGLVQKAAEYIVSLLFVLPTGLYVWQPRAAFVRMLAPEDALEILSALALAS